MILRATPRPRHSGTTAMEASSNVPSECGLICPQPMILPAWSTASTNRCQFNPSGLMLASVMILRIVAASARVAGRRLNCRGCGVVSIPTHFNHPGADVKCPLIAGCLRDNRTILGYNERSIFYSTGVYIWIRRMPSLGRRTHQKHR